MDSRRERENRPQTGEKKKTASFDGRDGVACLGIEDVMEIGLMERSVRKTSFWRALREDRHRRSFNEDDS